MSEVPECTRRQIMSDLKMVVICNMVMTSIAYICITAAAIWFAKPSILCWYFLPVLCGCSYKTKGGKHETTDNT